MALLGCSPYYSYSEIIYESSGNAASNGVNWVMANVIPQHTGLAVNGVVYRYTTVKNTEDDMVVYVQNENAQDGGYIFREADDWSGLPGNTISKVIPMPYIPIEYWGDGSIEIEGDGSITDPSVIYTYRYDDKCLGEVLDPDCPGYVAPVIEVPEPEIETSDEYVQNEIDRKATLRDEDQELRDSKKVGKEKGKEIARNNLEKMLGTIIDDALQISSQQLHNRLIALNFIPPQYNVALPSTTYEDTVVLKDSELPDNKNARRSNLAQQKLHQEMVDSQYQN